MAMSLTSRASAPGATDGATKVDRSTRAIVVGLVAVLGLVGPLVTGAVSREQTTITGTTVTTAAPSRQDAGAAAGRPARRSPAPDPAPLAEHVPPPRPLAPEPPAGGGDAPDPAVVDGGDQWALFSTQVGHTNVPVVLSEDLRVWSRPVDALPDLPAWAEGGRTWAPGVLPRAGGFVLYFAARDRSQGCQCIGVATAATVGGPYTSPAPTPLVCQTDLGGSIDPQPFIDRDGTAYLLWKADANAIGRTSQLFVQRLRPDGLALTGEPVVLLSSDAAWEQPLVENPALLAVDDAYVLLYSGGWYESAGYATGYALCRAPLGPCDKQTVQQPVLASAGDEAGTGGASVITGPAGDHWLVYHAWGSAAVGYDAGGARSLHFASLTYDAGSLAITRRP